MATTDEKKRQITWTWDGEKLELSATITDPVKRTVKWGLRDFYPHVGFQVKKEPGELTDPKAADELEVGLMVNGLKQRLSDKAAVGKDSNTAGERLDAMVSLGKELLEKRTYALGGGGGGLSAEAQWAKVYANFRDTSIAMLVEMGIDAETARQKAEANAAIAASKQHPKAPQAVMLMDLAEFNRDDTSEERCRELSKKYAGIPEFAYGEEEEEKEPEPEPVKAPEPVKPAPKKGNRKGR